MEFVEVIAADKVAEGQIVPVEAGGRKLFVTRADGTFRAGQRKCPHLGFNLCRGSIEEGAIVCPLHKARFSLTTGEVERDPKLLFIGMKAKSGLATYPVREEDGMLYVGV